MILNCEIVFDYADYDSVCSTPSAFRDLVPPVLMEAFLQSEMILLEPYLEFELRVTAGAVPKALYDLNMMGAKVDETNPVGEMVRITGTIPADTCKNYGAKAGAYTGDWAYGLPDTRAFRIHRLSRARSTLTKSVPRLTKPYIYCKNSARGKRKREITRRMILCFARLH